MHTQVWHNLGMSRAQRRYASVVQWIAFWLMTAFFFIPVGAVQVSRRMRVGGWVKECVCVGGWPQMAMQLILGC